MNVRKYIAAALIAFTAWSCSDDKDDLSPVEILPDYALPQGDAPKEANDLIQSLYDQYGSYFLYNVTQKDFAWSLSAGSGASVVDSIVLGKPEYTKPMLDYVHDIWLKYFSDDFLKGPGLPYRVMMVDSIKQRRAGEGWPPERLYILSDFKIIGKGITIAGMNENLLSMSPDVKNTKKNALLKALMDYYIQSGIITFPQEFYEISDYTETNFPVPVGERPTDSDENMEAYRSRGFLPSGYSAFGPNEWYFGDYTWPMAKVNDQSAFMVNILQRTDQEMAPYLEYPLIKQKFDLLVNHFKQYGIDVRAIANDRY